MASLCPAGLATLPVGVWEVSLCSQPVALWAVLLPRVQTVSHPRALFLQKRGLPYSQIHPQCTARFWGEEIGVPGGAGQSLVGLLLSDGTVRQGLDTSRQGRGRGGRGGGERKRRWGNRKVTMLRLPLLPGPCVSGATGGVQEGDKRQLKPVEVGHAPPPGLFAG